MGNLSRIEKIIKRSQAVYVVARHKKHSDMDLYRVLADCMEICEICSKDKREAAELDRLIKALPLTNGNKRQYVEKSSDVYQRTVRFMFHGEDHTANINRYAIALREAAKQGISSGTIVQELCTGGVNRFFLARPNLSPVVSTRCIRLDKSITHSKSRTITLKLKRLADNSYTVLQQT